MQSSPQAPQNESIAVNGQANNGANRKVQKSKYVPLEIDFPKARGGKPPRERNNNVSGTTTTTSANPIKRRDPDADAEYYASEREHRESRDHRDHREPRDRDSRDSRDSRNPRPYRASTYRGGGSATRTRQPVHSTSTRSSHPHSTAPSTRPSGPSSTTIPKRAAPIRASSGAGVGSGGTGGIQKTRPPRTISHHHQHQNGEFATADFPVDFSLVKKIVSAGGAGIDAATPFLMPYLGTYYYNGVPSYANMDTSSLKEAIRKQV